MIIGIGSDLIDIRRIAKVIERHGDRFLDRVFTDDRARQGRAPATTVVETYAKRFAAKEACAKALGTGSARRASGGATWGWSICRRGRPTMELTGGAKRRLQAHDPGGLRGADRPHHHRRVADGAGLRRDFGGRRTQPEPLSGRPPAVATAKIRGIGQPDDKLRHDSRRAAVDKRMDVR